MAWIDASVERFAIGVLDTQDEGAAVVAAKR